MNRYKRNKQTGKTEYKKQRCYSGLYVYSDMENQQTREERAENFDFKKWLRSADL